MFLAIGLALLLVAVATLEAWQGAVLTALSRGSFIAAFFTALTAIRSAAITDPNILDCGRFLAGQPPGRRYLALTLGGHLFGLVLSYGSISLLGALATDNAERETNHEIRRHRTRRMLTAVQRGFTATLAWSPLAFASAITLTVVPGASWSSTVPLTLVSALILVVVGWALDTLFKPRLSTPAPESGPAEGEWFRHMKPLYLLLAVLMLLIVTVHLATGIRVFGVVMALIPIISLAWIALQHGGADSSVRNMGRRVQSFATQDIPELKNELAILVMAAFIGSLGAAIIIPLAEGAGVSVANVPAWLLVPCAFWCIPITGQLGMNPLLAVSLFAPLMPAPEAMGVDPAVLVCALTSGWALSGATSPYTASVLLVSAFGKITPTRVGLGWNGLYALTSGTVLSLWLLTLVLVT
ncbi:hypothetical protein [Sulfitobacter dubius]|uniref:hypothetical protein n=1 Tax=Sulfitobacter dubius TaxID=218673 RepID=UPI001FAC4B1F|nr:hypothetical protein [Sulfitobacter dubius]